MGIVGVLNMKEYTPALLKALEESDGERRIAKFLKSHPQLIFWAFNNCGGHCHYVVPEFGIGKSLRCDFVLLLSHSGGWVIQFVELEPVKDPLYNKDRIPSKRLRVAQKQIADWRRYVDTDEFSLRNQLADAAKTKNCLEPLLHGREPSSYSSVRLRDSHCYLRYEYHIIISRRKYLFDDTNFYRSSSFFQDGIEIVTYDRLIEVAEKLDFHARRTREHIQNMQLKTE